MKIKIGKVINVILCIIVIICGFFLISTKFTFPGGFKTLIVGSESMKPTIKIESIVIIKQDSQYQVGDIITFKNPDNLLSTTTHRITKEEVINNQIQYSTKGDANNAEDTNKVKGSLIVGKVKIIIPYLGYLIRFIQTLPGLIIFIIIPATLVIIDEILKIVKEVKKGHRSG